MFLVGEIRKFVNLGHSFSSVQAHYIGLYAQYIAEQLNGKCCYREKVREKSEKNDVSFDDMGFWMEMNDNAITMQYTT